ncbi:MAG: nitroreductase [Actinobacteria bacterium]|nr:MAG: nitroreductase [Actinomycetota bacterium]
MSTPSGVSDLFDAVRRQRACRRFSAEPVADELVEQVLEAATFAPSAENRQPWVFVVVRDAETRAAIGDLTRRAWRGGARQHSEGRLEPRLLADVDAGAEGGVSGAPVLVVVGGDAAIAVEAALPSSIFPAVQNLLLAATALGLGSALTTLTTGLAHELAELVALPDHVRPMAVIPLGHPARPLGPPRREPVTSKTHRERYGGRW